MSQDAFWIAFHSGSYATDTLHLSTEQHGAYFLLLIRYWNTGPLPNAPDELAQTAKMSMRRWQKIGRTVLRFFHLGDDGLLHQKRADEERARTAELTAKSDDISGKRADAARASHRARSNVVSLPGANAGANAGANHLQMRPGSPGFAPAKLLHLQTTVQAQVQELSQANTDSEHPPAGASDVLLADGLQQQTPCVRDLGPAFCRGQYSVPERAQAPGWPPGTEVHPDGRPMVNGMYLDTVAGNVLAKAGLPQSADLRPLVEWLLDEFGVDEDILPAIERVAARGARARSLAYYDAAVRERAPTVLSA